MQPDYRIRPLSAQDEPILWEALYLGLHTTAGDTPPSRDIIHAPEFGRYVEGWGRAGDRGFVALDAERGDLLGSVWFREPTSGAPPELAFVVAPGQRKRGIGAALLTQWVRANPEQSEVALGVNASHPAVRLYERFGFRIVQQDTGSVTLRREVSAETAP